MALITFVIPVRHQDNARDWKRARRNLAQTVASISNQTCDDWRAIVVANEGANLPELPERFIVERVAFPPNPKHERRQLTLEEFYDAFRIDKGSRVLKGMLRARDSRFYMIVDDDDLISARIVEYVAKHPHANGWIIHHGYVWDDGGRVLMACDDFNDICGTSLIVRSDIYGLPERFEDASPDWIKPMLGGHIGVTRILAEHGSPLATLPFRGAVYRVANPGSHSRTPNLFAKYFLQWNALARPGRTLRRLFDLRLVGGAVRREFFGSTQETADSELAAAAG